MADGADVGTSAAAFNGRYAALFDGGNLAFGLAVCTVSIAYFGGFVAQTMAWFGIGSGIRRIWFYRIVYAGLQRIPASRATVLVTFNPVLTMFFAALLFGEKLNGKIVSGILLAVAGSIWAVTHGEIAAFLSGGGIGWGEVLVFAPLLLGYLYDDRQGGVAGD